MSKKLILALLALALLSGCTKPAAELPAPDALYAAITEAAALPAMLPLSSDEMDGYYGIAPEAYESAVAYMNADALEPDEIILVRAKDDAHAKEIVTKLESWLDYKRRSAANYLPENLPMLEAGVVRRDGLTVSLLVCDELDAVLAVYSR